MKPLTEGNTMSKDTDTGNGFDVEQWVESKHDRGVPAKVIAPPDDDGEYVIEVYTNGRRYYDFVKADKLRTAPNPERVGVGRVAVYFDEADKRQLAKGGVITKAIVPDNTPAFNREPSNDDDCAETRYVLPLTPDGEGGEDEPVGLRATLRELYEAAQQINNAPAPRLPEIRARFRDAIITAGEALENPGEGAGGDEAQGLRVALEAAMAENRAIRHALGCEDGEDTVEAVERAAQQLREVRQLVGCPDNESPLRYVQSEVDAKDALRQERDSLAERVKPLRANGELVRVYLPEPEYRRCNAEGFACAAVYSGDTDSWRAGEQYYYLTPAHPDGERGEGECESCKRWEAAADLEAEAKRRWEAATEYWRAEAGRLREQARFVQGLLSKFRNPPLLAVEAMQALDYVLATPTPQPGAGPGELWEKHLIYICPLGGEWTVHQCEHKHGTGWCVAGPFGDDYDAALTAAREKAERRSRDMSERECSCKGHPFTRDGHSPACQIHRPFPEPWESIEREREAQEQAGEEVGDAN